MLCTINSRDRINKETPTDLFNYVIGALLVAALCIGLTLYPSTGQAETGNDISDLVNVEFNQVRQKWRKRKYDATVVITNISLSEIQGPVQLIITGFKNARNTLHSADGVTEEGYSYINVELPGGVLEVGESTGAIPVIFKKMSKRAYRKMKKAQRQSAAAREVADKSPGWSGHDFPIKFNLLIKGAPPPVMLTISAPDAVPAALRVGTGKVSVLFTVSALTTDDRQVPLVLLRKQDSQNKGNDDGMNGDFEAGDGIFSFEEMIDTDELENGECLSYVGAGFSDSTGWVESEETLVCATHLPTELFETEVRDSKRTMYGEAEVLGNEVLVRFAPGASTTAFEAFLRTIRGLIIGTQLEDGVYQIFFDKVYQGAELEELFKLIMEQDGVLNVFPNYIGTFDSHFEDPSDPAFPDQHALQLVSANDMNTDDRHYAWDAGATGNGVTVILLDSGVNGGLSDDLNPLGDRSGDTKDALGHGTQMAAIIGASTDNSAAVAAIARDSQIRSIRVSAKSTITLSQMLNGFKLAKGFAGRDKVINASFSIKNMVNDGGICKQINKIINRGAVVVVSAGNHNSKRADGVLPAHCNSPTFDDFNVDGRVSPANKASLIVVGASGCTAGPCDTESRWKESSKLGSNYGDWVDISAPGVDVHTMSNEGLVVTTTGTSPATALVAGAAAVLRSCDVGGTLSSTDTTSTLGLTLEDVAASMDAGATVEVPQQSSGRLNLYDALASVNTLPTAIILSNDQVVENTPTSEGFVLSEIGVSDDTKCDVHEFTITGGADAEHFSIGGDLSNMLIINDDSLDDGILDFESKPFYEVEITVSDYFGGTLRQLFTIVVIDEVEIP